MSHPKPGVRIRVPKKTFPRLAAAWSFYPTIHQICLCRVTNTPSDVAYRVSTLSGSLKDLDGPLMLNNRFRRMRKLFSVVCFKVNRLNNFRVSFRLLPVANSVSNSVSNNVCVLGDVPKAIGPFCRSRRPRGDSNFSAQRRRVDYKSDALPAEPSPLR